MLKPQRIEIIRALAQPATCADVAKLLDQSPQRVNYHVKRLVEHGLVRQIAERTVRNLREVIYQAAGRSYWLSPGLVGHIGGRRPSDAISLGHLLDLAEEVQQDVAGIDLAHPDLPSLGISGEIRIRPDQRGEFLTELQSALQALFTKYGGSDGDSFKLAVACYPRIMTEPLIVTVRTTASPTEAFQAITSPEAVAEWLAEKAEIELPHRYTFWGPSVPEGDAPHQELVATTDSSLSFRWLLDGEQTTTDIAVGVENGETRVTVTQSHFDFNDIITGASIRGVLQTFWTLSLANLVDYLEGRPLTPRGDFTSTDLSVDVDILAPPAEVYDSLVNSEKVSARFGFLVEIEPRVGGRFAMGGIEDNPHPAIIVDLVPGERVGINWGPGGINTWQLDGSEGKTHLTLVSSGFDQNNPPFPAWLGMLAAVAELRRYHEIDNWTPTAVAA
ncbi:SRPBCC domain-containing protein [Nocardia brevicatena]|uniref:SRPBCC domain-containing protein n=1 Tax=Nocardia brevicatena TaxID=37327 RepID=UPI001FDF31D0|nr:SRPBCC domain-containing protein [Nocardia brevicatena]